MMSPASAHLWLHLSTESSYLRRRPVLTSLLVRIAIATLTVLLPAAAAAGVALGHPLETTVARAHFGRHEPVHKLCPRRDRALVDGEVAGRRREAELDHLVSKRQRRVLLRPHNYWAVVPVLSSDHPAQKRNDIQPSAVARSGWAGGLLGLPAPGVVTVARLSGEAAVDLRVAPVTATCMSCRSRCIYGMWPLCRALCAWPPASALGCQLFQGRPKGGPSCSPLELSPHDQRLLPSPLLIASVALACGMLLS